MQGKSSADVNNVNNHLFVCSVSEGTEVNCDDLNTLIQDPTKPRENVKVFYARKLHFHDTIKFDAGFEEYKPSLKSLLIAICKRLSNDWDSEEQQFIHSCTGVLPNYERLFEKHNITAAELTSKMLARYIKQWKDLKMKDFPITDIELMEVDQKVKETMDKCRTAREKQEYERKIKEKVEVYINGTELSLPMLETCIMGKNGRYHCLMTMLDTGASRAVASVHALYMLGYGDNDIEKKDIVSIRTAGGVCKSLGTWTAKLYLRAQNGKYYSLPKIEFLVMSTFKTPQFLLGVKNLRSMSFSWKASNDLRGEEVTLTCYDAKNIKQRRRFAVVQTARNVNGTVQVVKDKNLMISTDRLLQESTKYGIKGQDGVSSQGKLRLHKSEVTQNDAGYPMAMENVYVLEDDNGIEPLNEGSQCKINTLNNAYVVTEDLETFSISKEDLEGIDLLMAEMERGPRRVPVVEYQSFDPDPSSTTMMVKQGIKDGDIMEHGGNKYVIQDTTRPNYKDYIKDHTHIFSDSCIGDHYNEEMVFEHWRQRNSMLPPSVCVTNCEEIQGTLIPDCSYFDDEYRQKFKDLFLSFSRVFSKDRWDFQPSTKVPPVELKFKDNTSVIDCPKRHFSNIEKQYINEYVRNMVKCKAMVKLRKKPRLVYSLFVTPKSKDKTVIDKSYLVKSRQEILKESGYRIVSDLKQCNTMMVKEAPQTLPTFTEITCRLHGKRTASLDLSQMFHQLSTTRYEEVGFLNPMDNCYYSVTTVMQGWHSSVMKAQFIMTNIVLSVEAWDKFTWYCKEKYNYDKFINVPKCEVIDNYLDDIVLFFEDNLQLYFLFMFVLRQLEHWELKVSPAKTVIANTCNILGFTVDNRLNTVRLSSERVSAIVKRNYPVNREQLRSVLAMYSYYVINTPSLRQMLYCTSLLAKISGDEIVHLKTHKKEILCSKLLCWMRTNLDIICLTKPAMLVTDSSFGLSAGIMYQWTDLNKDYKKCLEESDSSNLRYVATKTDKYLQIVASYVKGYTSQFLVKSSYLKELVTILICFCHFRPIIDAIPKLILCCDCKSICLLARSKNASSRLSDFAQMLAAMPHVTIYHVDGNLSLCLGVDLLSRGLEGLVTSKAVTVPMEMAEDMSQVTLPNSLVISSNNLRTIMTTDSSEYLGAPGRKLKSAAYINEDLLNDALNREPTEQTLLRIIYGEGYKDITDQDKAFLETGKRISKVRYDDFVKRNSLEQIGKEFLFMVQNVENLRGESKFIRPFLHNFLTVLNNFTDKGYVNLKQDINNYLSDISCPNPAKILDRIAQSSAFNIHQCSPLSAFIPIVMAQHERSEIKIGPMNGDSVSLVTDRTHYVQINEVLTIQILVYINTQAGVSFKFPNKQFSSHFTKAKTFKGLIVKNVYILNDTEEVLELAEGTSVLELELCKPLDLCCNREKCKYFILQKTTTTFSKEDLGYIDQDPNPATMVEDYREEITQVITFLFNVELFEARRKDVLDQSEAIKDEGYLMLLGNMTEGSAEAATLVRNAAISISSFLGNNKALDKRTIIKLQETCPEGKRLRGQLQEKEIKGYKLINQILFKVEDDFQGLQRHLIYLDKATILLVINSMHLAHHNHVSNQAMFLLLVKHVTNVNLKQICYSYQCPVCARNQPPKEITYATPAKDRSVLGSELSCDLFESPELGEAPGREWAVLICVESVSGLAVFKGVKKRDSGELAKLVEDLFPFLQPAIIRVDHSSLWKGRFADMCERYGIALEGSCPLRSSNNPQCERMVGQAKIFLRRFFLSIPGNKINQWPRFITQGCCLFNAAQMSLTPKLALSRNDLFKNPKQYQPAKYLSLFGKGDQNIFARSEQQNEAFKFIAERREAQRRKLENNFDKYVKDFKVGQIVAKVKNKKQYSLDKQSEFQPSSNDLLEVLRVGRAGVRCINLLTGHVQTIDRNKLVSMDPHQMQSVLPLTEKLLGSFHRNTWVRGCDLPLYEALRENGRIHRLEAVQQELERRGLDREGVKSHKDEDLLDVGDDIDMELLRASEDGAQVEDSIDEERLQQAVVSKYQLRPRAKARAEQGIFSIGQNMSVRFSKKRMVRHYDKDTGEVLDTIRERAVERVRQRKTRNRFEKMLIYLVAGDMGTEEIKYLMDLSDDSEV